MSEYVLARALPAGQERFAALVRALGDSDDARSVLAELNDVLSDATPTELTEMTASLDAAALERLTPVHANYLAAMVEQANACAAVPTPAWTARIRPLERPHFATDLAKLRLHLLRAAPVPFKRRNLFVDAAIGARV